MTDLELIGAIVNKDLENLKILAEERIALYGPGAINHYLVDCDFNGFTLLSLAAYVGDAPIMQYLISKGADKNMINSEGAVMDSEGYSPFLIAASKGNFNAVKFFMDVEGMDANQEFGGTTSNVSILYEAAQQNHENVVAFMMAHGASPNTIGSLSNEPPMHIAIRNGRLDILQMFDRVASRYDKTLDYNQPIGDHTQTPLHYAVKNKQKEIVDFLLEKKVNIDAVTVQSSEDEMEEKDAGQTALHLAAESGLDEIAEALLKHGANPNAVLVNNDPLPEATPLYLAVTNDHLAVARLLLSKGAKPNAALSGDSCGGFVSLHIAVENKNLPMAQLLLENGANPNAYTTNGESENELGETPIHMAARERSVERAQLLLEHGADPDGGFGTLAILNHSPLQMAVKSGLFDLVYLLLTYGATLNESIVKQIADERALADEQLFSDKFPEVAKLVDDYFALTRAIAQHNFVALRDLVLEKKELARIIMPNGNTLLHCAVKMANQTDEDKLLAFIHFLLKNNVDKQKRNKEGKFALDYARSLHLPKLVNELTSDLEKQLHYVLFCRPAISSVVYELLSGQKVFRPNTNFPEEIMRDMNKMIMEMEIKKTGSTNDLKRPGPEEYDLTKCMRMLFTNKIDFVNSFIVQEPGLVYKSTIELMNKLIEESDHEYHDRMTFHLEASDQFSDDECFLLHILKNIYIKIFTIIYIIYKYPLLITTSKERTMKKIGTLSFTCIISFIFISTLLITPTSCYAQQTLNWQQWQNQLRVDAISQGISTKIFDNTVGQMNGPDQQILYFDKTQPEKRISYINYRNTRIDSLRIKMGRSAYQNHYQLLNQIGSDYGVDPCIVTAIWGIETSYGHYMGNYPVINSLATLAYDSNRPDYFRSELLIALHILNDDQVSYSNFKGEWAGASGVPQFMPSSWQKYAVDYDHTGRKDIWRSTPDGLASIANYLAMSGWHANQPVLIEVNLPDSFDENLMGLNVVKSVNDWQTLGVTSANNASLPPQNLSASIIQPNGGPAFMVFNNFNALQNYNGSLFYDCAVNYLADKICQRQ